MEINLVFHILGLSKTKNEDSIRDAYRVALKNNNPEDNPEGFKELRTAYEEALAYARTPDKEQDTVSPGISPEAADWLNKVTALYVDLPSRWDLSKWKPLMEDDICQNIDSAEEIKEHFITSKFRHKTNLCSYMFSDLLKIEGKAILDDPYTNCRYVSLKSDIDFNEYANNDIVCFNDTEILDDYNLTKKKLTEFLEKKFPEKSSYEV